jgi:hypothetical protein
MGSETSSLMVARQVSRTGEFELRCGADAAFPLFSPEGERKWIASWDPRPVFPETIEFRRDTVFREGLGAEETVWVIVDVDWDEHRAEYVRVAGASHTARIVVKIDGIGADRCRVSVSYTVTVFVEREARLLEAFAGSAYEERMWKWQKQIEEHLDTRSKMPSENFR